MHASDLRKAPSRPPVGHVPQRRERPRERRASAPRTSRGSPNDDPHHLAVIPLSRFRREIRRALGAAA
jgi:hypothetical protein